MTRKLIWLSIASACFIPVSALPLGLGPIQVNSSLNQALDAQIELFSPGPGEIKDLSIKLAPPQAFEQAGIERPTLLSDLGFAVQTWPDGRNVIKVTSQRAIREPSLNFLIELSGTAGRVVKEFTVLLDPPEFRESAPLSSGSRVVRADSPRANNERKPIPSGPGPMTAYDGKTYGPVAPGETLWRIANRIRPDSISVERMMQALLEANPHAFLRPNIDSLMAGVNLHVPTAEEITSGIDISQKAPPQQITGTTDQADGPPVTSAHVQLLEPELAKEGQTASEIIPTEISPQASAGSVPAISERFRIRLEGNGVKLRLAGIEDVQARIGTLMAIDHAALTAVQSTAEKTSAQPNMTVSQTDLVETAIGPEAESVSTNTTEATHGVDNEHVVSESEKEPVVSTQPTPITEQSASTVEVVQPNSSVTVEELVPVEKSMPADMWSAIADGPKSMALAGFGSVLLIGLGGLLIRRLRRFESAEDLDEADVSFPTVSGETPVVAPVAAGEVALGSQLRQAESRSTQSGSVVNPLERADLLIAVGNLRDAETTVRLVLAEDPDNTTLAAKLLDIQFAMGNSGGFREEAERLRDLIKDTADPLWQHVIEMGRSLCPGDALFGGGTESPWSGSKTEKAASPAATSAVDSEGLDLDLESLYGHVAHNEQESSSSVVHDQSQTDLTKVEEEPATLKFRLGEVDIEAENDAFGESFDLDWQAPSQAVETLITESDQTLILENLDDRLQELEFDREDDMAGWKQPVAVTPDEEQDDLEADLHSMEFDLEAVAQEDQTNQGMDEVMEFTESSAKDGLVDEDYVETKLDLALAYVDMEDPVGARTLLEEVLQEGNASQKQRADELMQRLSANEESSRHQILNMKAG